jgi:hypothetical protein
MARHKQLPTHCLLLLRIPFAVPTRLRRGQQSMAQYASRYAPHRPWRISPNRGRIFPRPLIRRPTHRSTVTTGCSRPTIMFRDFPSQHFEITFHSILSAASHLSAPGTPLVPTFQVATPPPHLPPIFQYAITLPSSCSDLA